MRAANSRVVLYSSTACVLALIILAGYGPSLLAPSTAQPCGERFANSTVFRLERDGALLSSADILDKAGPGSVGVVENIDVMRPRDTSVPAAMQIELRGKSNSLNSAKPGIAFPWQPRSVQKLAAACLSYKVFFYGDLEFQGGGVLPGLQGQDQSGQSQERFTANVAWRQDGQAGATIARSGGNEAQTQYPEANGVVFPRAGWVKIDQEVILNSPGQFDGILRVWVDGSLAIEKTNIGYRSKPDVLLSGVATDVFYGAPDTMAWAPSDTRIWISPLEISWR
jgi:polysaccharide lyase-like protein